MKIGLVGYKGKMAQSLIKEIEKSDEFSTLICYSRYETQEQFHNINITNDHSYLVKSSDIVIDFSRPETSMLIVEQCIKNHKPIVCGTTGFTINEMDHIRKLSKKGKVFYSANMSISVGILGNILQTTVRELLKNNVVPDVSILERHHRHKVDKPSGTAMSLASKVKTVSEDVHVDIVSLRYGMNTAQHEVIISTDMENITLKHQATDRSVFAAGALAAAKFLIQKTENGFYDMESILKR